MEAIGGGRFKNFVLGPGPKKKWQEITGKRISEKKVTGLFAADRFQSGKIMVFWPPVSKKIP